ncbi:MAG TPA: hemolysin family protein [Thermoanaerobaculia bacterium]|nr:hemolysin family protein [Thermoanaerobaculia bacterium]
MSTRILLEIGVIVLLVLANGAFSMSEIAVVTSRRARLDRMARSGRRGAAAALRLAENPDRFLSTIQVGITLIGVFTGAFGGATLAAEIGRALDEIPALDPYSEAIGVGVVVLGITYLTLVLGELVPKRIALGAPERIAARVAPLMNALARIGSPLVSLLGVSTRAVLTLLRIQPSREPSVTEEELKLLLHQGTEAGTIPREERIIVERVFLLGDRSVRSVMTPRIEVEWIDLAESIESARRKVADSPHSRFPVAAERLDEVEGILHGKDLWAGEADSLDALRDRIREPLFVPETASALALLETFRATRNHVAIVVDEYGGFEGLVTPADILEALVGELPDPEDTHEPVVLRRADGSLSLDATVDLEEVKILIGLPFLEGQKETYQTIAGWVVERLGRIPKLGDVVEAGGFRFEILDMDGRRVDRILVSEIPLPEDETVS